MFSEAYIMFSIGLIKPFQKAMYPNCFSGSEECPQDLVKVQNYLQLVGIIIGMPTTAQQLFLECKPTIAKPADCA
jgi:hypothetical protein